MPAWAQSLTPADFERHGLATANCADSLIALAAADDVDLERVTRCLELLRSGHHLLHLGAPLALMAYSPRLQRYRACFDGAIDVEPTLLTEAQAGLWLTRLASEQPTLPTHPDHWGVIAFGRDRDGVIDLEGNDTRAIAVYRAYAHVLKEEVIDPDRYDEYVSFAVWTCIRHALDGR